VIAVAAAETANHASWFGERNGITDDILARNIRPRQGSPRDVGRKREES